MNCLLPAPSLPRRLLRCPFEPVALALMFSLLLSIWTCYSLMVSDATTTSNIGLSPLTTATSMVTASSTVTVNSTSTLATTLQTTISINETALEAAVDQYSKRKIDHVNAWMNRQVLEPVCAGWGQDLRRWNESLNLAMDQKKNDYNSFLAFKNSLSTLFQQDSTRINETLDSLARTALNVGSLNAQEIARNFTLRYWLVDDLFSNFSSSMADAQELFEQVRLPVLSCPTFYLTSANISGNLTSVTGNLTTAMHNMAWPNGSSTSEFSKRSNQRPSVQVPPEGSKFSADLKKRCRLLSVITCTIYVVIVIFLCLYEILRFSLEKSIFNFHIAGMLDRYSSQEGPARKEIQAQQEVRSTAGSLAFSLQEPVVYKICETFYFSRLRLKVKWSRLTAVCWWLWSSGKIFWILLAYTMIYYQMITSMIKVHQECTPNHALKSNDNSANPTVRIASPAPDPSSLFLGGVQACENFEQDFSRAISASIDTFLTDVVNARVNDINALMVSQNTPFGVISWDKIEPLEFRALEIPNPDNFNDLFSDLLISGVIKPSLGVASATQKKSLKSLQSKDLEDSERKNTTKIWQHFYRWTLVVLVTVAAIHHLLGSMVSTKL